MMIDFPALIVGLILLTYWIRVLQMVRKARKTAGHDANFIPREPLGRALRILWMPTVFLWIFVPLISAFVRFDIWFVRPLFYNPIVQWLAVCIAVVSFVITWICWRNMGKSWRMGINPEEKTELVFSGPFAYVRNPIYGLSQVLMLCAILVAPMPLMFLVGLIHVLFMQWEVRREEKYLLAQHGEAYKNYLSNVGRFLPKSLRPYRSSSQQM
jgi:protein-S-isoprenylcysteine O-methyltransferase Ste14